MNVGSGWFKQCSGFAQAAYSLLTLQPKTEADFYERIPLSLITVLELFFRILEFHRYLLAKQEACRAPCHWLSAICGRFCELAPTLVGISDPKPWQELGVSATYIQREGRQFCFERMTTSTEFSSFHAIQCDSSQKYRYGRIAHGF